MDGGGVGIPVGGGVGDRVGGVVGGELGGCVGGGDCIESLLLTLSSVLSSAFGCESCYCHSFG